MSVSLVHKSVDSLLLFSETVTSRKLILLNDFSIVNFMAGLNLFKYWENSFNFFSPSVQIQKIVKNI